MIHRPAWLDACVSRPSQYVARGTPLTLAPRPHSGTGLAPLSDMHKPMDSIIRSEDVVRYNDSVKTFSPDKSTVQTASGEEVT